MVSRLIGIADAFDTMVSERTTSAPAPGWRESMSCAAALAPSSTPSW
jgi:hypothetical protein